MRCLPVDQIEEIEAETGVGQLNKSLGLWQLTAIGVGGIIGVGIFSLAGLVAHGDADNPGVGPAVLIAFLIAGLASAAAALSYAEFAGMIPRAGSAYTYGYVALGELVAWFIGWDLLLEYIAIVAVVAIGISGYLGAFLNGFGIELPLAITASAEEGGVINIPAILICLLVTFILSRGTKTFGRFELIAVGIKIVLILFIIGLGIFYINTANYNPLIPSGVGPVLTGAATVFFAVFGYDAMSTAAEEAEDGKKHMPKAIILSLIIAMTLYVAATLVLTGMQRYTEDRPRSRIRLRLQQRGPAGHRQHHLRLRGALHPDRHADIPARSHPRLVLDEPRRAAAPLVRQGRPPRNPPTRVTWIAGVGSAVLAGVFPIREVADLTNIGILSAFIVVCAAVILFRYTRPDTPRSFRLPWMPVVPAFGVLASLFLILQLPWQTWLRFAIWLVIGLSTIYFAYGRKHSLLNPDSPLHRNARTPPTKQ